MWAVQLPLAHTRIESTVRYHEIEADDALAIAERDVGIPGAGAEMLCPALAAAAGQILTFAGA